MDLAHLFEAGMLVCFGFSWPINVIKAYRAGTARSTSLAFICLIITGYILGIGAKIVNRQFNYVLSVYVINLVIVFSNVIVYFRNCSLDRKREEERRIVRMEKKPRVVYAHEEHIVIENTDKREAADKNYNVALLGGTYAKDIPSNKLAEEFNFDFNIYNKSTFALSLKHAKEYFNKYVSDLNTDGIIIQLGKEDRDIFRVNPSLFDTMYLDLISCIKNRNKDCRLALVSINNTQKDAEITDMNNHIKAIAQSEQASFVNLDNAKLWNPKAVQASVEFARGMGLKVKKPIFDVAEILFSYAYQNITEETPEMNIFA